MSFKPALNNCHFEEKKLVNFLSFFKASLTATGLLTITQTPCTYGRPHVLSLAAWEICSLKILINLKLLFNFVDSTLFTFFPGHITLSKFFSHILFIHKT